MTKAEMGKAFFEAVAATSYIADPALRQDMFEELMQTMRWLRQPPKPVAERVAERVEEEMRVEAQSMALRR